MSNFFRHFYCRCKNAKIAHHAVSGGTRAARLIPRIYLDEKQTRLLLLLLSW